MHDLIIIGKGAAGLACAIYTSRAGIKTLVIGKKPDWAGQHHFDNYLGFEKGIVGEKLFNKALQQAKNFGVDLLNIDAIDIERKKEGFIVKTSNEEYNCKALLFAVGNNIKYSGINGEKEFAGKGVHYCVPCDGYAYKNKKVVVVGNKDFAANEAIELLKYTKNICIYTNGIKDEISPAMKRLLEKNKIKIKNSKIIEIWGQQFVEEIVIKNQTHEKADGLFMALGHATGLDFALRLGLEINENILTVNNEQKTKIKGIFAAGDCCNNYKQFGVAVGEGVKAAFSIIKYLSDKI